MTEEEHDDFSDDKTYDGKQYDAAAAANDDDHDYDANDDNKCRHF
jgi:hypothetical protein